MTRRLTAIIEREGDGYVAVCPDKAALSRLRRAEHRVAIRPELLRWARERASRDPDNLAHRFPWLPAAERGEKQPTQRQLEGFAKATHAPLGYLFLPAPPEERLPIQDFRAAGNRGRRASPDLLDTIYAMQRRQWWLREDRIKYDEEPLSFVGGARLTDDPAAVGQEMRRVVGIGSEWPEEALSRTGARDTLRLAIERIGVMAVIDGVVGNDTSRKLDVEEFCGFALCDAYAPLIFVNGATANSAQTFTLAHELAHLWLGPAGEGLSGFEGISPGGPEVETFCARAAAEFLSPASDLVVRRDEVRREPEAAPARNAVGGDFYSHQAARVGRMFAVRVIEAARAGQLSFVEAYALVGLRGWAFQEYGRRLGLDSP